MIKKFAWTTIFMSVIIFALQAATISLALVKSDMLFWMLALGSYLLSVAYGLITLLVGHKYSGGDGYIVTASWAFMMPLVGPLIANYFSYRTLKENRN